MVPVLLMYGLGGQDALGTRSHAAVQAACCGAAMARTGGLCAAPALSHRGARRVLGALKACLDALLLAQPFPVSIYRQHSELSACVGTVWCAQLLLGLLAPVIVAAAGERQHLNELARQRAAAAAAMEVTLGEAGAQSPSPGSPQSGGGSSETCAEQMSWLASVLDCSGGVCYARGLTMLATTAVAWDCLSLLAYVLYAGGGAGSTGSAVP